MRTHKITRGLIAVLLVTLACSDNSTAPAPTHVPTLTITASSSTVYEADAVTFTAVFRDANGVVVPNAAVTWTIDDSSRAQLGANGYVLALKAGTVKVTGQSGGVLASKNLAILRAGVQTVSVLLTTATMSRGDVATFGVKVEGPGGRVLYGREVVLASDNPAVALIDASGRVRAVSPGFANIRATCEGVVGTSRVQVSAENTLLQLRDYNGMRLPLLVASDSVVWNGVPELHEVYVEFGHLTLSGTTTLRYEIDVRYAEYNVITTNGRRSLEFRMTQREYDRGLVEYDSRGDLQLTSELVYPLTHTAFPITGGMQVRFRIGGTDEFLQLFYRREPE